MACDKLSRAEARGADSLSLSFSELSALPKETLTPPVNYMDEAVEIQDALDFVPMTFGFDDETFGPISLEMQDSMDDVEFEELFVSIMSPTTAPDIFSGKKNSHQTQPTTEADNFLKKNTRSVMQPRPRLRKCGMTRREELLNLREEVKTMENQLAELQKTRMAKTAKQIKLCQKTPRPSLWRDLAQRQQTQCQKSQEINAVLRAKLKSQVRKAKSLMRTLQKRSTELVQHSPKQAAVNGVARADFTDLLQSMGALYIKSDDMLACSHVASLACPHIRQEQIKRNNSLSEYLEFQDSRFIPFSLEIVKQAMWRFLRETSSPSHVHNDDRQDAPENTILRTYGVEIETKDGATKVQGNQAIRRYFQDDSVVIVRRAVMTTLTSGNNRMKFVETGWMQLKALPDQHATLLRGFSTITPLSGDAVIPKFMTGPRKDMEDKAFQVFESIIFEEAKKQSACI